MRNKTARDWYPSMKAKPDQVEPTSVPARDVGAGGRLTNQRLNKQATTPPAPDGMPSGPDEAETRKRIGDKPTPAPAATAANETRRKKTGPYNRTVRVGKGA